MVKRVCPVWFDRRLLPAWLCLSISTLVYAAESTAVRAQQVVKVTPLGTHDGEVCAADRAFLFEDPTGVRILYDPGRPVDDTDPRLGDVDVMLLSHAHGDHLGDRRGVRGGTCAMPAQGTANPATNFASIAAAKRSAAFFVSIELDEFVGRKIEGIRGSATPLCVPRGSDSETVVPRSAPCTARVHPGGSLSVRRAGASAAVQISGVQAVHPSSIPAALVDAPGMPPGISAYGGTAGGFIVQFTNGLVVYLSGDTGFFSDMELIGRYYRPTLAVLGIGGANQIGPSEAAFVLRSLMRPATVLPTHVAEQSTQDGVVISGSKLDRFIWLVRGVTDVVVPFSGVTRSFDADGRCVGCR